MVDSMVREVVGPDVMVLGTRVTLLPDAVLNLSAAVHPLAPTLDLQPATSHRSTKIHRFGYQFAKCCLLKEVNYYTHTVRPDIGSGGEEVCVWT